jgi:hypothetical protein
MSLLCRTTFFLIVDTELYLNKTHRTHRRFSSAQNGYTKSQKHYVTCILTILLNLAYLHYIVICGKGEEEREKNKAKKNSHIQIKMKAQ